MNTIKIAEIYTETGDKYDVIEIEEMRSGITTALRDSKGIWNIAWINYDIANYPYGCPQCPEHWKVGREMQIAMSDKQYLRAVRRIVPSKINWMPA